MLGQNIFNAMMALMGAYLLFVLTNRDGITLPRPITGYYFVPNETTLLLEEAGKEAARVAAATRSASARLLEAGEAGSRALAQYGVALKAGDEALEATIEYVHQYQQLTAAAESRRRHGTSAESNGNEQTKGEEDRSQSPVCVHVFLAADNGSYSGMHELFYIRAAMRYSTDLEVAGCRSASFGFLEKPQRDALTWRVENEQKEATDSAKRGLLKIPVLAVTTGIYVTSAAACTTAVMQLPMFDVQSVTLIGTSGASPVVGGGGWHAQVPLPRRKLSSEGVAGGSPRLETMEKTTNPSCQRRWDAAATKVALGSVCVTYGALLQECGHCIEDNRLPSLCSRPRCAIHNSTTFFGPCAFKHPTSSFAERMKGAMYRQTFPTPPAIVKEAMRVFWAANEAVPLYAPSLTEAEKRKKSNTPKSRRMRAAAALSTAEEDPSEVLSYNRLPPAQPILLNCAEVGTSQILAGPRSDLLCREYTAELFEGLYPDSELSCIQAMEGFGVLHVMTRAYPHIPVAIVRGVSNYDMYPLARRVYRMPQSVKGTTAAVAADAGKGTREADGEKDWFVSWDQKEYYLDDARFHGLTKASYRYSIETASAVVLNYFLSAETVLPGMT